MGKVTGLLREITGALTGDRSTEARGRAGQQAADTGEAPGASVPEQLDEVRELHGDIEAPKSEPREDAAREDGLWEGPSREPAAGDEEAE